MVWLISPTTEYWSCGRSKLKPGISKGISTTSDWYEALPETVRRGSQDFMAAAMSYSAAASIRFSWRIWG